MKNDASDRRGLGPALKDGLTFGPILSPEDGSGDFFISGARVFENGTEVFSVNETGSRLLEMADGSVTIDEMVKKLKLEKTASEVGMFFVKLSKAGYLKNRVAIELYESENKTEVSPT